MHRVALSRCGPASIPAEVRPYAEGDQPMPTIACPRCDGDGSLQCKACSGVGLFPMQWAMAACEPCGGSGRCLCTTCEGEETVYTAAADARFSHAVVFPVGVLLHRIYRPDGAAERFAFRIRNQFRTLSAPFHDFRKGLAQALCVAIRKKSRATDRRRFHACL